MSLGDKVVLLAENAFLQNIIKDVREALADDGLGAWETMLTINKIVNPETVCEVCGNTITNMPIAGHAIDCPESECPACGIPGGYYNLDCRPCRIRKGVAQRSIINKCLETS